MGIATKHFQMWVAWMNDLDWTTENCGTPGWRGVGVVVTE